MCLSVPAFILLQAITGCKHNDMSRIRIELHDLPSDKQAVSAKPVQRAPMCPPAGLAPLQLAAPGTGHHKVTLTWNASAHTNNPESDAYGYCLYRSQAEGRSQIKTKPDCPKCEQVNRVPVLSTGCVDDLVMDNAHYYYVVAAINASGSELSVSSNEAPVYIPKTQSVKPLQPSSLPLCRATPQSQTP
jgi:hypothetical protein